MIAQVGTISANSDTTIGTIIAEAMEKVGKDGVITVEEARTLETSLDVVEGMQFDRGYLSPYFVTDPERMEVVARESGHPDPREEDQLDEGSAPAARAGGASRQVRSLIIAEDVEGEALATLVVNKLRGTLQAAAVKAPGFGDRRKADARRHRDRSPAAGRSRKTSASSSRTSSSTTSARRRRSRSTRTTRRSSKAPARPTTIQGRVKQIRAQIEDTTSDYDREKLQERLAKLAGGVAVIKVGAATETEMKEKKARVEDAMHATKAAVEEGIVPGGGVALLRAAKALDGLKLDVADPAGRRQHHPPRDRRAAPLDRARTRARKARSSSRRCKDNDGRVRLQRRDRDLREPRAVGRHRPHQGGPHGPAERLVDRVAPADHRSARSPRFLRTKAAAQPQGGPGGGMGGMLPIARLHAKQKGPRESKSLRAFLV